MTEQQTDAPEEPGRVDPDSDAGVSLPPQPKPKAEPQVPPPGGPHAVPGVGGDGAYSTAARDPDPAHNPATDNELPAETTEPDDTDTEATRDDSAEVNPSEESTA